MHAFLGFLITFCLLCMRANVPQQLLQTLVQIWRNLAECLLHYSVFGVENPSKFITIAIEVPDQMVSNLKLLFNSFLHLHLVPWEHITVISPLVFFQSILFFMSKAQHGNKVVKSLVFHRQCSTCNWWRRNRPGKPLRKHRCVHNHSGSARLMESTRGENGILEMKAKGAPAECLEVNDEITFVVRLKNNCDITVNKKFNKNHIMKKHCIHCCQKKASK